jgi:outer membrane protein W
VPGPVYDSRLEPGASDVACPETSGSGREPPRIGISIKEGVVRFSPVTVVTLVLALACGVTFADDARNNVRARVDYVMPSDGGASLLFKPIGATLAVEPDPAWGGEVGYERRVSETIGINLAVATSKHDLNFQREANRGSGTLGQLTMTPITASVFVHLSPESRSDFYLGGGLAYVHYDMDWSDEELSSDVEGGVSLVLEMGLDVPLGSVVAVSFNARYTNTTADFEGQSLALDPVTLGVGLTLMF